MDGDGDRFLLLNDLPVDRPGADLLNTSPLAADLGRLIIGSRDNTPFVVAVDGRWGTGKSTLMRQLSGHLDAHDDVEVVWFNAWTASGVDAMVGMIKVVLGRLDPNVVRRAYRRMNRGGMVTGAARLVLTALAGLVRADRALDDLWARVPVDAQAREQVKTLLESALTEWSGRTGRPRRTIVVFVDDLDRCGDRTALEICEAIKLYLDVPGIAFVLGCDLAVLARVPVPGGADAGHVRGYLEKIIQVNYQIPAPSAESVQAMIHGYAERSGTARLLTGAMTDLVGRQTGGNPRRVKRLLNSFVAEYQLDRGWLDFGTEGLLVAVALQHFYPSFYREILARTDDTVGELLSFAAARQWLATGNEPEPDDDAAEMFLGLRGMMPVENRDPAGRRQITAELDSMVPLEWPVLAGSPDCLELLRDIGDEGARLRLQQRLRRRPLSTSPTPAAPSMAGSELTSLRVLWIDDEPADSGHLRYHVASRGAHVTAVPDVQNAIAALPRFRPNAVLSDVFRDGAETGFDDLRALVEAGYAGPSYFLTSRETPELREKAKRAGADGLSAVPGPVLTWLESLQREIDPRRTGPDSHDSVRP